MKTIKEQHQQWCVHYHRESGSPKREACQAGIVYDDLAQVETLGRTGCMLRLPCIRCNHTESERRGQPLFECPKLQWPTLEESEAREKEIREYGQRMRIVEEVIAPLRKEHRNKNWWGVIECPICKGELTVRHHGYNNHFWVTCATKDCVSWIE